MNSQYLLSLTDVGRLRVHTNISLSGFTLPNASCLKFDGREAKAAAH